MRRFSSLAFLVWLAGSVSADGAPAIQVHPGAAILPGAPGLSNGSGSVDFGAAPVATIQARTITVKNSGDGLLLVKGPIHLPPGFTLVRTFGTTQLAAGQTTTFVVAMNSARAGRLGGLVSFWNSATPNQRFGFLATGTAFGPPSLRIIQAGDPGFKITGRQVVGSLLQPGTGTAVATWTFNGLQPGHYRVAATWTAQPNQASRARYTILNGKAASVPVLVNQTQAPSDFRDAGASWKNLADSYFITGDSLVVKLSDRADAPVHAGAVRIERVGFPGRIATAGDPAASTASANRTRWTFSGLVPGQYRISAAWTNKTPPASPVLFTILDDKRAMAAASVDMRPAPHDLRDGGATWKDLGGLGSLHTIRGRTLEVLAATTQANGLLHLGAIRVERIYNPAGSMGPEGGLSQADAVRFLEQSTWGPYFDLVNHVQQIGFGGFLAEQFDPNQSPISSYPSLPQYYNDQGVGCPTGSDPNCGRDNYTMYPLQLQFFYNAMYGPDQLRQRAAFALHKIVVVSGNTVTHPDRMVPYLQIFDYNAFGNYRDILAQVTLNPAMGDYLSMRNSTKTNPNENYGREVLQLFSIGLDMLNPDGTPQLDSDGNRIPTYNQDTITNFARVFTGYNLAPAHPEWDTGILNYLDPMIATQSRHDTDPKTLLYGTVLPAGQSADQDVSDALDNIFYHDNVGPFIGKSLIQQLVTSNPTPAYVARVAAVFNDNGQGTRGDLSAVVAQILLDPEARGDIKTDPSYGKLREPAQFANNILRAFNALSFDQSTNSDGYINPQTVNLDQDILRPPTVFSYFSPSYVIPGTGGVVGPEFQILSTVTSLRRANFANNIMRNGIGIGNNSPLGTKLDLSPLELMSDNPPGMVDYLNQLLLHGTMSNEMRTSVLDAINAVNANNPNKRAWTAAYLVTTSSHYQVQR